MPDVGMRATPRECESAHDFAVLVERALRSQDWWAENQCEISPPDGEEEADNFGVVSDGVLVYIVRVESW